MTSEIPHSELLHDFLGQLCCRNLQHLQDLLIRFCTIFWHQFLLYPDQASQGQHEILLKWIVTWVKFGLKRDIETFEAVFRFPRPSKIGGTSENENQVDFFGIRGNGGGPCDCADASGNANNSNL